MSSLFPAKRAWTADDIAAAPRVLGVGGRGLGGVLGLVLVVILVLWLAGALSTGVPVR